MNEKHLVYLAGGVALGFVLALAFVPANTDACCQRLAGGIRDKVTDKLGDWAGPVGDHLGLWQRLTGFV